MDSFFNITPADLKRAAKTLGMTFCMLTICVGFNKATDIATKRIRNYGKSR